MATVIGTVNKPRSTLNRVSATKPCFAMPVDTARRWLGEIADRRLRGEIDPPQLEFWKHQQIRTVHRLVEPVDGQDVGAGREGPDLRAQIDLLENDRQQVIADGRRTRSRPRVGRSVARGDLPAIEVCYKSIIVFHPELQTREGIGGGQSKRHAHVTTRGAGEHGGAGVSRHRREAGCNRRPAGCGHSRFQ